jgi:hypothetical protein
LTCTERWASLLVMPDTRKLALRFASATRRHLCRAACRLGAKPSLDRPVFIVGCGRSGTTALGEAFAEHPAVTYLNEYRNLWEDAYPVTDVWSPDAAARGGMLELTEADCTPSGNRRLIANFHCETFASGRPRLVEKLPINNFRLSFVDAAIPEARFVHLLRNGLEVARSIAKRAEEGRWYGHGGRKWDLLVDYARRKPAYMELTELCETPELRGLLEWRMSVDACLAYLDTLPSGRYMTIRYGELLDSPIEVMKRIQEFVELVPDAAVERFAEGRLKRRSSPIEATSLTEAEERIAGDLMRRLGYLRT